MKPFPIPVVTEVSLSSWVRHYLRGVKQSNQEVPCGTCHACCQHGYEIELHPEDAALEREVTADGREILKRKPDGSCYYLTETGCTIYPQRPKDCRTYDCRKFIAAQIIPSYPDKARQSRLLAGPRRHRLTIKTREDKDIAVAIALGKQFVLRTGITVAEDVASAAVTYHQHMLPEARRMSGLSAPPEAAAVAAYAVEAVRTSLMLAENPEAAHNELLDSLERQYGCEIPVPRLEVPDDPAP